MKSLAEMLTPERVVDLTADDKRSALVELVDVIAKAPEVTDPKGFLQAILDREKIMSTGMGIGIAVPHVKIASVTDFVMAIGRHRRGLDFDSLDKKPVYLIIMIAAAEAQKDEFLKVLSKVASTFREDEFRARVMAAKSAAEVVDLLRNR